MRASELLGLACTGLKARADFRSVLTHYGLTPGRGVQFKICCPFHDDGKVLWYICAFAYSAAATAHHRRMVSQMTDDGFYKIFADRWENQLLVLTPVFAWVLSAAGS